ncbi:MAG: hypothetical protein U9P44_02785, partial [archaeon]|nr:hypothetical protein [archaeon]
SEQHQDAYWMMDLAKSILYDHSFQLWGRPQNMISPVYPASIAMLTAFTKDFFLSGKVISLIAGILAIPAFFYLCRHVYESKNSDIAALIATALFAIHPWTVELSVRLMMGSIYLFISILSFLFLFKAKENKKWLPLLALTTALSVLVRWEGYALTGAIFLTYVYWQIDIERLRKGILKLKEPFTKTITSKSVLSAIFIYSVLVFGWWTRNVLQMGEIFPSYWAKGEMKGGGLGFFGWMNTLNGAFTPLVLLIAAVGIYVTYKKHFETYLPLYLYLIFYSVEHMIFPHGFLRYAAPLTFVAYILVGVIVLEILKKNITDKWLRLLFVASILIISLAYFINVGPKSIEEHGTRMEIIQDFSKWYNNNAEKGSVLLASDKLVYGYYIDDEILNYDYANSYARAFYDQYPDIDYQKNPFLPYIVFVMQQDVRYWIPYDSVMSWFYPNTKRLCDKPYFKEYSFDINNNTVILKPIRQFEKNGQNLCVYETQTLIN